MNNTFEWNRFCEVVRKDFRNLWPLAGRTMLILALLPMMIWIFRVVFPVPIPIPSSLRLFLVVMVTVLAGCATASRLYRTWNIAGEGIYFAMLPASKREKFLSAMFFSVIVCPLLVFASSVLVDTILTLLPIGSYSSYIWQGHGLMFSGKYSTLVFLVFLFNLIALVPLYMYASTYFRTHKVLRTSFWVMAFYVVSILVRFKIFNSSSVVTWLESMANNFGKESVANIFMGFQLALPIMGFFLFAWLTCRRLDRMGY